MGDQLLTLLDEPEKEQMRTEYSLSCQSIGLPEDEVENQHPYDVTIKERGWGLKLGKKEGKLEERGV